MGDEPRPEDCAAILEGVLFAADAPLSLSDLVTLLDGIDAETIKRSLDQLNEEYDRHPHSFQIMQVAGGYQLCARPQYARWIKRLYRGRVSSRLSQAALECLSIVAYKQPISRTEIEAIRGVNVEGVLRTLLERSLIRIAGRGDGLGRPILYATTNEFLRYFGLNRLSDLPKLDELKEMLRERDQEMQEAMGAEDEGMPLFPKPQAPVFERNETE